ncbi:MAG: hypothetical protein Kilf2KO_10220 [Rhodospirillales bacterium]
MERWILAWGALMERLTVEIRRVPSQGEETQYGHTYLIYRDAAGLETMISGRPTSGDPPDYGPITVQIGVAVTSRERNEDGSLSDEVAGLGVLDLGAVDPGDAWAVLLKQAANLDAAAIPYELFDQNSNATVATLLHVIGLDADSSLPESGLDPVGSTTLLAFDYSLTGTRGWDLLQGGVGDDSLSGAIGRDRLLGGSGDDRLSGGNGPDTLEGGNGSDRLDGGTGGDLMFGGLGDDLFFVNHADDSVRENPGGGEDRVVTALDGYRLAADVETLANEADGVQRTLYAHDRGARLVGNTAGDSLVGASGADELFGGLGDDRLLGRGGDDDLQGRAGADRLFGGGGDDLVSGEESEAAADWLAGGDGDDTLLANRGDQAFGGAGADSFVFDGNEVGDRLNGGTMVAEVVLNDFGGVRSSVTVDDRDVLVFAEGLLHGDFSYLKSAAFTEGGASEARFDKSMSQVEVDVDGDAVADIAFRIAGLAGGNQLTASDFIWLTA